MASAERSGSAVGPEGELRLALTTSDTGVLRCELNSTRPDIAGRLLQGRTTAEIVLAVPRVFSICSASQGAACELALAATGGSAPAGDLLARCQAAVAAETVRESARRALLDWPRQIGETAVAEALAAARSVGTSSMTPAQRDQLARAVFGEDAAAWLARDSPAALRAWAGTGIRATARFMHAALQATPLAGEHVPLLPSPPERAWLQEVAQGLLSDSTFAQHPVRHGAPAETGALARLQADPLVAALLAEGSRVVARHTARLRELARMLAGHAAPTAGGLALADGLGLGWVDNARGLLLHLAKVEQGRATLYRIVAPTDWNFHPSGALATALDGTDAGDPAALRARVAELVDSLDPCVNCRIEIRHA